MTAQELRKEIDFGFQDLEFVYNGKFGSICPFNRPNGTIDIYVAFDGEYKDYTSVDDVMTDKFFDNKALDEITPYLMFH